MGVEGDVEVRVVVNEAKRSRSGRAACETPRRES